MLPDEASNPWKITALAVVVIMVFALAMGLVVAQRDSLEAEHRLASPSVPGAPPLAARPATTRVATVPTAAAIRACNRYAGRLVRRQVRTVDVVADSPTDGAAGAGGTLYGLDPTRQRDEPYREAYGACMRARGYTG